MQKATNGDIMDQCLEHDYHSMLEQLGMGTISQRINALLKPSGESRLSVGG